LFKSFVELLQVKVTVCPLEVPFALLVLGQSGEVNFFEVLGCLSELVITVKKDSEIVIRGRRFWAGRMV